MAANIRVPATTRQGWSMPFLAARAIKAATPATNARTAPALIRAVTRVRRGSPEMTSLRSVIRAAETWKYMAVAARKPAVQPAVMVSSGAPPPACLLYTSDAADDLLCVDLGGRR